MMAGGFYKSDGARERHHIGYLYQAYRLSPVWSLLSLWSVVCVPLTLMTETIFPLESFSIITGVPSALADVIVTLEEDEEEDDDEELVPVELLVSVVSVSEVSVSSRLLVRVAVLSDVEDDMAFSFLLSGTRSPDECISK